MTFYQKKVVSFISDRKFFLNDPLWIFEERKKAVSRALAYQYLNFEKSITGKESSHRKGNFKKGILFGVMIAVIFYQFLSFIFDPVVSIILTAVSFLVGIYNLIKGKL